MLIVAKSTAHFATTCQSMPNCLPTSALPALLILVVSLLRHRSIIASMMLTATSPSMYLASLFEFNVENVPNFVEYNLCLKLRQDCVVLRSRQSVQDRHGILAASQ